LSDRLALAQAIADAGIPREKAENIASTVGRLVEGGVTTKADLQAQGAELKNGSRRLSRRSEDGYRRGQSRRRHRPRRAADAQN
jgi:hypothetical protein